MYFYKTSLFMPNIQSNIIYNTLDGIADIDFHVFDG